MSALKVCVPVLGIVFGYWLGVKMEEWAHKKIWNLKERSDWKVRFIRFQQWVICFSLLMLFAIAITVVLNWTESTSFL